MPRIRLHIRPKEYLVALVAAAVCLAYQFLVGVPVLAGLLGALAAACLVGAGFAFLGRVSAVTATNEMLYRQIEALFGLYHGLGIRALLPPMRRWAVSPDFGLLLVRLITSTKPQTVLDLGSGVSTVLMAYALGRNGRVIGVDHNAQFADSTRALIEEHGLSGTASVVHVPLAEIRLGNRTWQWYDSELLKDAGDVDVIVVDGPPRRLQADSRYPALPVLYAQLSRCGCVVLDDAGRPDERKIIGEWLSEFPDMKAEWVDTEKGACILRRIPAGEDPALPLGRQASTIAMAIESSSQMSRDSAAERANTPSRTHS